ncbi:MAG: hypothetical protein GY835_04750 [bacterium]|nr:hypothetical protein [bacterium]
MQRGEHAVGLALVKGVDALSCGQGAGEQPHRGPAGFPQSLFQYQLRQSRGGLAGAMLVATLRPGIRCRALDVDALGFQGHARKTHRHGHAGCRVAFHWTLDKLVQTNGNIQTALSCSYS